MMHVRFQLYTKISLTCEFSSHSRLFGNVPESGGLRGPHRKPARVEEIPRFSRTHLLAGARSDCSQLGLQQRMNLCRSFARYSSSGMANLWRGQPPTRPFLLIRLNMGYCEASFRSKSISEGFANSERRSKLAKTNFPLKCNDLLE